MEELLLEKKLTTDFTIGFELEAIWLSDDNDGWFGSYEGEIAPLFDSEFPGGDLHSDGSLHGYGQGVPFEWASPVLPFNVKTIQKIISFYEHNLGINFVVNSSCGYHNHISFPGISVEDMVWIMSKLSLDDHMRDLISHFEGIDFVGGWSNDEYLDELAEAVRNNDASKIVSICNTDKYSLVNVHYNKTLEWRGPRGFLENGDKGIIIKFYKRLYQFISWITDVLDEDEIEGISRDNFNEMIRAALPNTKEIKSFTSSHKEKHKMTQQTINNLVQKIIGDNHTIYRFINQPKNLEILVQTLYNRNRLGFIVKKLNEEEDKNEGNLIILNNLCYKYIPYRMVVDYADLILPETYAKSSDLTLNRLLKTSKKDGQNVTMPQKFEVLSTIVEKSSIDVISPDNFPNLYNTEDWTGGYKILIEVAKKNWIDKLSGTHQFFTVASELASNEQYAELKELIDLYIKDGATKFLSYFPDYVNPIIIENPAKYIDVLKNYEKDNLYKLIDLARVKGVDKKLIKVLKDNDILSDAEEISYDAKNTRQTLDSISRLENGPEETEVIDNQ